MPPSLHIQLLGDFRLTNNGKPVTGLDSPRLQSLLAYLLLHRDAPQSRQHLAFLLYPDSTEARARGNLRSLLHQLRQFLPDADIFLDANAQTLQWRDDAPFLLDVDAFEKAVSDADSILALREAVDLYHGDLLASCYDDWILPERERLQQKLVGAMERLSEMLEEARDFSAAAAETQKLLRRDPLREETYRQLMRLHSSSGDRAAVHRVYQDMVALFKRELDAEPSEETRRAYEFALKTQPSAEPLSEPKARTSNLPIPVTSFVGRRQEVADIKQLIAKNRLVTLTGAGGSGKTRLAIRVATDLRDDFLDGAWWVTLVALNDPTLVPQAVANAMAIREVPNQPITETLARYLEAKNILLVLDNCEHLVEACANLTETLLESCSNLKMLTTSREPLGILGESVFQVPTLSLPATLHSPLHEVLEHEATRLFVERAMAVKSDFALEPNAAAIAQLCRRLDGIPLAIELAAARVKVLSPQEINTRLDDRFELLTSGSRTALPRHQTLRATIDWSYNLLTESERVLFRRLAVFAGGFTLDTARSVCAGEGIEPKQVLDLLSHLVDKSLVIVTEPGPESRYQMLETIRDYAREKLREASEEIEFRNRHLDYFVALAEEAEQQLFAFGVAWFARLEAEHDNLRAAMEWSLEDDRAPAGLRLMAALWYYWFSHGPLSEAYSRTIEGLERPAAAQRTKIRARALNTLGILNWGGVNQSDLKLRLEEALEIGKELDDNAIIATSLRYLGLTAHMAGDFNLARSLLEQSLAIERESTPWEKVLDSQTLLFLGDVHLNQGNTEQARVHYGQSIDLLSETKDKTFLAYGVRRLGQYASDRGDLSQAIEQCRSSLTLNLEISDRRGVIASLAAIAGVMLQEGQFISAALLFGAVEVLLENDDLQMLQIDELWHQRNLETLRARLDDAAVQAAWTDGHRMTLEQAIELALKITS